MTTRLVSKDEAPKKILHELVRPIAGQSKPVVIKTKMINKTDEMIFFPKMKPMPRAYFVNAIIKRTKRVKKFFLGIIPYGTKEIAEFVVRHNAYWSEALTDMDSDKPTFSQELENLKLSDSMKQHIDSVEKSKNFQIDGTILKLMAIVFGMSVPFGFLMDVLLNLVPHQIVNWIP